MFKPFCVLPLGIASLALVSMGAIAQDQPTHVEITHVAVEHHADTPDTSAGHSEVATRLRQEADAYDKEAAEHEKDAVTYRQSARLLPKANHANLADHCDRLAKSLKASAAEAREVAQLHADIAKNLAQ